MPVSIDYGAANKLLEEIFAVAEDDFRDGKRQTIPAEQVTAIARLFKSDTQAYREALVGCCVARLVNPKVDVHYPDTTASEFSFSGRSLADKVVTPALRAKAVPVSASPYLSSLRGGAKFIPGGQPRIQRDQEGFDTLVFLVEELSQMDAATARKFLRRLLAEFVELREAANIHLRRVGKPSLPQLMSIIHHMLGMKSGGRVSSYVTVALFQTLGEHYDRGWDVEFQGINVADKFTGAVGDVTVKKDGATVLGVEITERPISRDRVTLVFDQKISPAAVKDYLFVTTAKPDPEAFEAAKNYTAAGHDMNFVDLSSWAHKALATIGPEGRTLFQDRLVAQLASTGVPAELRLAWNEALQTAISSN
ncbi:MAG: restriction endonuclease, SacI family [Cucumibacter sp.]